MCAGSRCYLEFSKRAEMAASGTDAPCLTLQRGYLGAAGAARAGVGNARDALRARQRHAKEAKKAELRYKKRLLYTVQPAHRPRKDWQADLAPT